MTALETQGAGKAPDFSVFHKPVIGKLGDFFNLPKPRYEGGIVIPFQGKTTFYYIEAYDSGSRGFTEQLEYSSLVDQTVELYLATYPYRDHDMSVERIMRGLSHPRTKLLIAYDGDVAKGFGLFPRFSFEGEPVIYSSRAFLKEGDGLGTGVLDLGIQLHQEDAIKGRNKIPSWGVLMTQNVYSKMTLDKLKEQGRIKKILPFDVRYDDKVDPDAPLAKRLMGAVHNYVNLNSAALFTGTGVSRGELREVGENEVRKPDKYDAKGNETAAWKTFHQMFTEATYEEPQNLGMSVHNGDVDYIAFKFCKPGIVVDTRIQDLTAA